MVEQLPGRLDLDPHVGQLELQGLAGLGLVGILLLQVLHALVQRPLGQAHAQGGDGRAGHVQGLHGDLHAFAFLAQQVGGRDVDVLEQQFHGVGAADAQLVVHRADGEARGALLDDEGADALHARRGIGERVDHDTRWRSRRW